MVPLQIQTLKLSKIDYYLGDNVFLLRLSELKSVVKQKTGGHADWTLG